MIFSQDEALAENKKMVAGVKAIADAKEATVAQLSLAWLYYKAKVLGVEVLPIPGTTKVPHFVENYAATKAFSILSLCRSHAQLSECLVDRPSSVADRVDCRRGQQARGSSRQCRRRARKRLLYVDVA